MQAQVRLNPDASKPPSKRRKLQPLQPTVLVDKRALFTKRYTETMRHTMADLVHQYLPLGSEERALADEGRAHLIDFQQYRRRNQQSPIAAADRDMCARYPESFASRAVSTRHETLRKWFVHIRSPTHAGGGDGSARDLPRHAQPGKHLQPEDWEYCERVLLHWRWQDESGRRRRYRGLQHAFDMKSDADDEQSQADAEKLADILKRSKARGYENLTACVMLHCRLSWATEQFHEPRKAVPHYIHARRYLSKEPVLEYYRSKEANPDQAHRCKVVKVRLPNAAYQLGSSSQQRKRNQNTAAPVAAVPDPLPSTRLLQSDIEQRLDRRKVSKFVDHDMLYDDSKEQITASVDGFSVWLQPDDSEVGHKVCVAEGEQLPTLRIPKKTPRKNQDKNYYMCITLAGYGALDTALMQSGSKERSGTDRGSSKYWFERIVEMGLNFKGHPQAEQMRRELQERLAATTWTVRVPMHTSITLRQAFCETMSSASRNSAIDSECVTLMRTLDMQRRFNSAFLSRSRSSCCCIAASCVWPKRNGLLPCDEPSSSTASITCLLSAMLVTLACISKQSR